jgi:hypothetical protein
MKPPSLPALFNKQRGIPVQGHRGYRFLLGTTIWMFLVSSHTGQLDDSILSLHEDGVLRVRSGGQPTLDYLRAFAAEIAAANAKRNG